MSSLWERNILYARLEEVAGVESVGIPMSSISDRHGLLPESRIVAIDDSLDRVDARFDRMEAYMVGFDEKLGELHQTLREQTRTYMLTMTGVTALLSGVVVATAILT